MVSITAINKGLDKKQASGEPLGKLSLGMTDGSIGLFTENGDKLCGVKRLDIHTAINDAIVVTVDLYVGCEFFEDK